MNIGILGSGFGAYHAKLLAQIKDVDKIVVFGRNPSKLTQLRDKLGVTVTSSADDILLDPSIDAVDICLPSSLHSRFAVEAVKQGKHVFCETPVCCGLEEAELMRKAAEEHGRLILVNQFIKFDPAYAYLHKAVQNRTYGKLLSVSLFRETPPLWGNLGLDAIAVKLMIHELDMLTWLLEAPELMNLWGSQPVDRPEQSLVRAFYQSRGTFAEVLASSQMPEAYPFTVGYDAYFEEGKLSYRESDGNGQIHSSLQEYTPSGERVLSLTPVNPYEASLKHALECFAKPGESLLTLEQAARSLRLALQLESQLAPDQTNRT
ncbi:dehydrogenase [Paenibacillus sp. CAA11]|uniref:Gfo/Idh/MocA family protein n=1 Tax=Paenibacillus sp. CAA11 TaxID=1532905 RepID=UPI000D3B69E1|nr:Gfo/Idh/MocA family oxidoreductase [Paenibacillus sp. CAA11]AWB43028.1 dehydrogenase [Paenibacillus sp. CAA11]